MLGLNSQYLSNDESSFAISSYQDQERNLACVDSITRLRVLTLRNASSIASNASEVNGKVCFLLFSVWLLEGLHKILNI